MMRILWIEDNQRVIKNKNHFFGNFLSTHELHVISDFNQANGEISIKLYCYDLIILDINLEASSSEGIKTFCNEFGIKPSEFLKEAGFHLYVRLLEKGFPKNQVVFLTANCHTTKWPILETIQNFKKIVDECTDLKRQNQAAAKLFRFMDKEDEKKFKNVLDKGNKEKAFEWLDGWARELNIDGESDINDTYEVFENRFKEARITPPKAIDKKQENLKAWLESHCSRSNDNREIYDYLTLRRSILDIVSIIKDPNIKLNQDFQKYLDKAIFLDGLICYLRDFSLSKIEDCQIYMNLCEYLTKPFQEAYGYTGLINKYKELIVVDENYYLKLTLCSLRNWIVHGLLTGSKTKLSAQEVGVTFLLAIKGMFGEEQYGCNDELKRLFNESNFITEVTNTNKKLSRKYNCYDWQNNHKRFLCIIEQKTKRKNRNWQQENYICHFYATYYISALEKSNSDELINKFVYHELNKHL